MSIIRALTIALSLLLAVSPLQAQTTEPQRLGLVLGGGGARGLAHVGVIRRLEELGIRADVVTGTSMGAIIASLYASGLSAAEIEAIALNMDWSYALSDDTDRRLKPYRRRQDDYDQLVKYQLPLKDGQPSLPLGLITGQHLDEVLRALLDQRQPSPDFDQLPIPFRAVAADLATGQPVVLKRGSLATAVRASMAIPGIVAPVEYQGRLLVDGGIANNLPMDVARQQLGANRLVVVEVGTPLLKQESISSVVDVANQLTNLLVSGNVQRSLATLTAQDLLLQPALDPFSAVDFQSAAAIIDAGYQAALGMDEQLQTLVDPLATAAPTRATAPRVISAIEIDNDSHLSDALLRYQVRQPLGQPLDSEQLGDDLQRIYGFGAFERVTYHLQEQTDGTAALHLEAKARPGGSHYLRLGLSLADDFEGGSQFNLAASLRLLGLNAWGGEWFNRVQIGESPGLFSEFYQPLGLAQRWFVAPSVGYRARNVTLYDDQWQAISQWRVRQSSLTLAGGYNLHPAVELRVGVQRDFDDTKVRIGPRGNDGQFNDSYWFTQLAVDTLDDVVIPTEGVQLQLRFRESEPDWGSDSEVEQLSVKGLWALHHGRHVGQLAGEWVESWNAEGLPQELVSLGGFQRLSGLPPQARWGTQLALLRGSYLYRLAERSVLPVDFPAYLGLSLEVGNVWNDRRDVDWGERLHSLSLFLALDTGLGPAYLTYGRTEQGDSTLGLFLGQLLP